jgi:uncharacterized protein
LQRLAALLQWLRKPNPIMNPQIFAEIDKVLSVPSVASCKKEAQGLLRRELHPVIAKAPADVQGPVLDFTSSDETLDRYDEIIVAQGWQLDNYRKNPVVQNAHNYGDIIHTIGRALDTKVQDGKLCQRVEFAVNINPIAKIAYGLYQGKFLNAVSVGFIPLRWENGSTEAGFRRKYLEQELLEVSAVGIPANPNALQNGLKEGAITKSDLQDLLQLLTLQTNFATTHSGPQGSSSAQTLAGSGAQLLRELNQLRTLLSRA